MIWWNIKSSRNDDKAILFYFFFVFLFFFFSFYYRFLSANGELWTNIYKTICVSGCQTIRDGRRITKKSNKHFQYFKRFHSSTTIKVNILMKKKVWVCVRVLGQKKTRFSEKEMERSEKKCTPYELNSPFNQNR